MITSLDRHLRERGYTFSIIRDREFTTSKQVLEGKAKLLRESGRGKRPNKARQLSQEEEEILWEKEKLGSKTPEALVQTMWWLLTQHFGLRGRQEHHQMKMGDFSIVEADNGVAYIQYKEGPTKTRQGGLNCKPRNFQPRMFQTQGERCPVALFREYVSRRPLSLQQTGPFYLSVKTNRRPDDHIWYKVQPMGVNKIDSMMKNIVFGTSLECSGKKFSNHSARKTVVGKLKKANLERSDIAKVTGHRNIQSLDDYDEADEQEQQNLSLAISRRNYTQEEKPRSSSIANIMSKQSTMNSQAHNMINTFHGCNVTFKLSNRSPVSTANQSRKRRFHIIESDSGTE
ncbi:uncharacterized protein KIAA1958-like [Dendronephthya gigantea]|uniref:uncharacterized protein KIAA1958-like n=1 Tax=Dendronephthya gigantea TaxID=151771 RepID=UPI001069D97C|nr:uncharacterized protein KIAA1958-like [Dendronephthya gigantea]